MILGRDERGAAAIEYALIGSVIALGIVAGLVSTKRGLNTTFDKITFQVSAAVPAPPPPPRVVASTYAVSYSLNGTLLTQNYTTYTDGTKSMVQTNSNPTGVGYGVVDYEFDTSGNVISSYVRNPDGTFQYSESVKPLRDGVDVHTITPATSSPYAYSQTQSVNGALTTIDKTMLDAGTNTGLWTTQRVVVDASNASNVTTRVTCTFGSGPSVAC